MATKTKTTAAKANTNNHARLNVNVNRTPTERNEPVGNAISLVQAQSTQASHFARVESEEILRLAAIDVTADDASNNNERVMDKTVAAFNTLEGTTITSRQAWTLMQMFALAETAASVRSGKPSPGKCRDISALAARAGEAHFCELAAATCDA